MKSLQNNRLVRKYYNCSKCKELDTKLVNPFANHIYCAKCGSLLSEIPEMKYKKYKNKLNQNNVNRNEEDKKIPYKLKDNIFNRKKQSDEKVEDKKIKKQKKHKKNNNNYNKNRHQSTSHYSNMNINFYDDNNNNYHNNNYNNNQNNINRININIGNDNDDFFNFNDYNYNNMNNINNESQRHKHKNQHKRGQSMSNPHMYSNNHYNNNNNNFFANFFSDMDFEPFSDNFNFPNFPRMTVRRHNISNDIFDPMFSSFGSFFDGFFQDNFSSNFRSNVTGDFFSQILSILERNRAEANKNKHPPATDTALNKLKKFSMNEKYCKKDKKGKIELPNCCICLTEIQKGEKTVLLPCGHMFHWKCCLTWLKTNNTCPMCRFEIK